MKVFLFAHQNIGGGGIAQAKIPAATYTAARKLFDKHYPKRELMTTGVKGEEG